MIRYYTPPYTNTPAIQTQHYQSGGELSYLTSEATLEALIQRFIKYSRKMCRPRTSEFQVC